jgi:hypothetical protein
MSNFFHRNKTLLLAGGALISLGLAAFYLQSDESKKTSASDTSRTTPAKPAVSVSEPDADPEPTPEPVQDTPSADELLHLGLLTWQRGDATRAAEIFTTVLQQDPQNSQALLKRALVYNQLGQYQAGLSDVTHAGQLNPDLTNDITWHYTLGKCLFSLGQFTQAQERLEFVTSQCNEDSTMYQLASKALANIAHRMPAPEKGSGREDKSSETGPREKKTDAPEKTIDFNTHPASVGNASVSIPDPSGQAQEAHPATLSELSQAVPVPAQTDEKDQDANACIGPSTVVFDATVLHPASSLDSDMAGPTMLTSDLHPATCRLDLSCVHPAVLGSQARISLAQHHPATVHAVEVDASTNDVMQTEPIVHVVVEQSNHQEDDMSLQKSQEDSQSQTLNTSEGPEEVKNLSSSVLLSLASQESASDVDSRLDISDAPSELLTLQGSTCTVMGDSSTESTSAGFGDLGEGRSGYLVPQNQDQSESAPLDTTLATSESIVLVSTP